MIMNNKEKVSCDVMQDLLPLYQDGACSEASKHMLEAHLRECASCQSVMNCLQNTKVDDRLIDEKKDVLQNFAKKERKRTYTIGVVTAAVLMIPIIVCLICNLAIGNSLDWFFIVLASLAVFASVTVVPMIVEQNVGLWTLGCFTASLLSLLLIIDIYVAGGWFLLAAVPIIFSLSILFAPYVIKRIKLPIALSNKKGLLVMLWDTFWLFAIIVVASWGNTSIDYWQKSIAVTTYNILLPWILFVIIRYGKLPLQKQMHGLIKAGICTIIVGIYAIVTNGVMDKVVGGEPSWKLSQVDFANWSMTHVVNANINMIILISTVSLGILLIVAGIFVQLHKRGTDKQAD